MTLLIGIAGHKRSGKTTLANMLAAKHKFYHTSFAAPLRAFICDILDISLQQLEDEKEKPIDWLDGVTPRHMLQTVGTEWGRAMVHPDLWVRSALRRTADHHGTVISDVRFENEAYAIHAAGGKVLRLSYPGVVLADQHVSEKPIPDCLVDAEISNQGTKEDLLVLAESVIGI